MYETFLFMRIDGDAGDAFNEAEEVLNSGILVERNVQYSSGGRKYEIEEFVFDEVGDDCIVWNDGVVYRVRAKLNDDNARRTIGQALRRFPAWCVFQPGEGVLESVGTGPLTRALIRDTAARHALVFLGDERGESHIRSRADALTAAAGPGAVVAMLFPDGAVVVVPSEAPAKIIAVRLAVPLRAVENWAVYDASGAFAGPVGRAPSWQPAAFSSPGSVAQDDADEVFG